MELQKRNVETEGELARDVAEDGEQGVPLDVGAGVLLSDVERALVEPYEDEVGLAVPEVDGALLNATTRETVG
jgi:hypothetical protein